MATASGTIGTAMRRREDRRLLTGGGRYVGDLHRPGLLHVAIARSPYAHARVERIDTATAAARAGVVAVVTAADLAGLPNLPVARVTPEMRLPPAPLLTGDSVHHVGQPVAAVVATSLLAATDALAALDITYTPLPAVVDPEAALAPDATLAFPALGTNLAYRQTRQDGEVAAAFAAADSVVRLRLVHNRIAGVPMEPRAALAEWEPDTGHLTLWTGTQAPYRARAMVATMLGLAEADVRVIAPDVGGGFGVKGGLYQEEVLTAWLSRHLGQPVRWLGTRADDLQTTVHAREQVQYIEAAARADGLLLGLRARVICNLGAGARGAGVPSRISQCIVGCYTVPAVASEMLAVYTNTTPTGAYRGAGRPEAALAIERIMDEVAAVLGLDPAAVRRRNFVTPDHFPYRAPTGITLDSGDYERGLDECLRRFDYDGARQARAAARARGELVGIGLATYLELTGSGWEAGTVRVLPSGQVEAITGSTEQGQGHATTWAQIVGDALGVPPEQVTVRQGDTRLLASGIGSFGSRSTVLGGGALALAAEEVKAKMLQLAAHRLEVAVDDLEWHSGGVAVRGAPARRLAFREVAALAYGGAATSAGLEPGLETTRYFDPGAEAYTSGAHAALVRMDRATGLLTVERYVAVDDCGRAINPLLVEGQQYGGLAQGIGQALWEQIVFDADGQLLSGSLMDYALPRASMLPPITLARVETPSPLNPLGAKGIGEAGPIAAPAALLNAAVDALRPLGVTSLDMPLTPERLWRAIHQAERGQR